jgi:multiple sugar transport system permease protein
VNVSPRANAHLTRLLSYLIALIAVIVTLFPIMWVFNISIRNQRDAFALPPDFSKPITWQHYESVWMNADFRETIANTAIVTALGVALAVGVAVPSAYGLLRFRFRGRSLVGVWLILAYMLPEFLFVIPMYVLYQSVGLYDTHFGLALVYQVHSLPFAIWLIRSFFQDVPRELDDAARIDGCAYWQVLWRVYVPVSLPGIAATAILTAIWIWNELTIALALTFANAETITVGVAGFRGYAAMQWGAMAAASIISMAPMLLFAVIAQRYIVKGLTLGGVKG